MATAPKMKVEIWSDIMCPFCYIGKRHYEEAAKQFANNNDIEVEWKSFQLDPTIPDNGTKGPGVYEYLAERKGMSLERSKEMHQHVMDMAKNAGLDYNFDKAVVANSFKAHRIIQLAKAKGLGDRAEEQMFRAYFTEGKDLADVEVLVSIAESIGLAAAEAREALTSEEYAGRVKHDIAEAQQIGVTGVPFFVFDRKYAVSGAQPAEAFVNVLERSFGEWKAQRPAIIADVLEGPSCAPGEDCK